jgi:predicted phage tail protein
MLNIHLYNDLADNFGPAHKYNVSSVGAALRLFNANYPGFFNYIRNNEYAVVKGKSVDTGECLSDKELVMKYSDCDIHIVPVIEGNKSGWTQILIGVVMIVAAYFTGGTSLAFMQSGLYMMGAGMVLGGVSTLLSPVQSTPNYTDREDPDERASFVYNGPLNTTEQGNVVSLIYGKMIVGSTVISAELDIEEVAA